MARKKSDDKPTAAINFRVDAELKASLEDLAYLSRRDVSSLLVEICIELVEANKQRIANFRRSAAQPINLPTFEKPVAAKKKKSAQVAPMTATETATPVEGTDTNAI